MLTAGICSEVDVWAVRLMCAVCSEVDVCCVCSELVVC